MAGVLSFADACAELRWLYLDKLTPERGITSQLFAQSTNKKGEHIVRLVRGGELVVV